MNSSSSNRSHPYSKFTKGSLIPREKGIDVSEKLIQFFWQYFLPSQAVLVVVNNQSQNQSILSLSSSTSSSSNNTLQQLLNVEQMCQVFEGTLAREPSLSSSLPSLKQQRPVSMKCYHFPGQLDSQVEYNHMIIKGSPGSEKMVFQWVLNQNQR